MADLEKDKLNNDTAPTESEQPADASCEKKPKEKPPIKDRLRECWLLFITFFKIGIMCFGGGYAMIALVEREIAEKKKWLTHKEILDIIAIAESTPGVISINMATFVGTKRAGFFGAVAATVGVALPSFLIIFVLSFFIIEFKSLKWVNYAFLGIRAAVLVLILNAVLKFFKQLNKNWFTVIIAAGVFAAAFLTSFNSIYILLICAVLGVIFCAVSRKTGKKKGGSDDLS